MKRRNVIIAFMLTFVMAFGTTSVFANTYGGVAEDFAESTTYTFVKDVQKGKYNLVDTEELKTWVDSGKKMCVVDTMPDWSYDKVPGKEDKVNGHVPGAINAECGTGTGDSAYVWGDGQKSRLVSSVKADLIAKGLTKKVYTYSKWAKTTKTKYKKITNKNLKKMKKVKGKYVYYKRSITKTTVVADKSAPVVVYCGFIGCARSHIAAVELKANGFTNVYRYGGGILAWKDAKNEPEFAPEDPTPEPEKGEVTTGAEKEADFSYDIDLSTSGYDQENRTAKLWVPIPQSDDYQTITDVKVVAENAKVCEEKTQGANKYQYIEFDAATPAADRTATVSFHVVRKAIASTKISEFGEVPADIKAAYVDGTFFTMGDDADKAVIKAQAEKIVADANATTIEEKAKAIFDWEINKLYRRQGAGDAGEVAGEENYSFAGCGRGEVVQVLTKTFGGKCTDLNSTYVALCRAVGVPAREKFGIRLDNNKNGNNNGNQHCRAEVYIPGTGWVEADPADALKTLRGKGLVYGVKTIADMDAADVTAAKEAYWGANDNNWVKLAVGRDITLDPAQSAACTSNGDWERCLLNKDGSLNNLGYVYGEMVDADNNAEYMDAYAEGKFGYVMNCTVK